MAKKKAQADSRGASPSAHAWPAALIGGAVLLTNLRWLTNRHTPGSDGWRILPYVEFADHANQWFPLWNPHILGGVPVLADPERFVWLSWLLDADSRFFNLGLNLVILGAVFLFGLSTYALGRRLSLDRGGATLAAIVLVGGQYVLTALDTARLNGFLAYAMAQTAWLCSLNSDRGRRWWLAAAALTGAVFSLIVHYALPLHLIPLALIHWCLRDRQRGLAQRALRAAGQVAALAVMGSILLAVFLLPLVYYNLGGYSEAPPRVTLGQTLPQIGSLINSALPVDVRSGSFYRQEIFPFVSLLVLPLLALAAARRRILRPPAARFALVLIGLSLIVLLGRLPILKEVVSAMEHMPGLWHIRHSIVFHHWMTLGLALLCGIAYDRLGKRPAAGPYLGWLGAALALFLAPALLLPPQVEAGPWRPLLLQQTLLTALALVCLPWPLLPAAAWRKAGAVGLLGFQLLAFRADSLIEPVTNAPGVADPVHQASTPQINQRLRQDRSYFRVLGARSTGVPKTLSFEGYSLYFAPEHRLQMELLYGQPIPDLRPYWHRPLPFGKWNREALQPLNIKYWVRRRFGHPDWRLAAQDPPWVLWERKDWVSALRLVRHWDISAETGAGLLERLRQPAFLDLDRVLLDREPSFRPPPGEPDSAGAVELHRPSSDSLEIRVESDVEAVLFIPEYYDSGWDAWVDDSRVPLLRANGSFRAVAVPAGRHLVRMRYRPGVVLAGLALSLASLAGCLLYGLVRRRSEA